MTKEIPSSECYAAERPISPAAGAMCLRNLLAELNTRNGDGLSDPSARVKLKIYEMMDGESDSHRCLVGECAAECVVDARSILAGRNETQ